MMADIRSRASARQELARQLVACAGFRWIPGMRWTAPIRPGGYGPEGNCGSCGDAMPWEPPNPEAVPDLDDAATIGCLVLLLDTREVYHEINGPYHPYPTLPGSHLCRVFDRTTGRMLDFWGQSRGEAVARAVLAVLS